MALPKGKLMALLAVFAAIGIVTATGAFTSVSADRTATAEVVGDDSALLQLNPTSGAASISGNVLTIDFTDSSATGLNPDATTRFEGLFTITNNGASETNVSVAIDSGSGLPSGTSVTLLQDGSSAGNSFDVDNVAAGSQAASVGMEFTTGSSLGSWSITIRIEADDTKGLQNTFTP